MKYKETKLKYKNLRHLVSAPFIYGLIFPMATVDLCTEVYHRVCFPLYGIDYVERGKYIKVDRQKLDQLSRLEKINCMYCGYVNGILPYITTIAGETEKYWCGIKHAQDESFVEPTHHKDFVDYEEYA